MRAATDLERVSRDLARRIHCEFQIERTPSEIADTLLIESGYFSGSATELGMEFLRGHIVMERLIEATEILMRG